MRVKKIDIFGFKSFATKQSVTFGEGVTAVVGPNGCGKSNVVDALRWVMGEQNARHLRGGSMQDIIFCGSEKKAPLGFAQVTLTIENDKGDAPLEYNHFNEIEISRRLYKTGESEYEINKQKARLKDISDFFLGTGVGTKAYSIIEQGRVNDMISAKPHDRRLIIEEAAGITKYKAKKATAERRMESCRVNLNRIVDIKNEVDKRLVSLAKEKEKLLKVQGLKTQIKEIDLHISVHQYLGYRAQETYLEKTKLRLEQEVLENQRETAFLDQAFGKTLADYAEKHDKKRLLTDLETQHKTTLELLKKDIEYTKSTQVDNEILTTRLAAQIDEIEKREAELMGDMEQFGQEYTVSNELFNAVLLEHNAQKNLGQTVIEGRHQHIVQEQSCSRKIVEAATKAARLSTEITLLQEQERKNQVELKNLDVEIDNKDTEHKALVERLAIIKDEFKLGEHKKLMLEEKIAQNKDELSQQLASQSLMQKRMATLKDEHVRSASRLTSLQEIDKNLSWSDSGVSEIIQSNHAHLVRGILAEVVKAKTGHEDTVEKCLSHMLDAALVSSNKDLSEAVSLLKSKKSAKTSFFMLDSMHDQRHFTKPLGLTSLNDLLIISHNEYQGLRSLFAHIFVANSLQHALEHWPAARLAQATIVSTDGEVLFADGRALFMGADNEKGVLKRKNELTALLESTDKQKFELEQVIEQAAHLDKAVITLRQHEQQLQDEYRPLNIGLARLEETIKQKSAELDRFFADLAKLKQKKDSLAQGNSNAGEKLRDLSKQWSDALLEHKNLEEELEALKSARIHVEADYEAFQQRIKEIEVRKASLYEKTTSLKNTREQAEKNLNHIRAQKQSFNEQIDEKLQSELRLKEHLRQTEQKMAALHKELLETSAILLKIAEECDQIRLTKESAELEIARVQSVKQTLTQSLYQHELLINNAHNDIKNLEERINERYRLKIIDFISDFHHRALDEELSKKERDELKKICDRMGSVNENASAEFDELHARSQFLENQVTDLTGALEELEQAIKKINKTTKTRFLEAFSSINKQFSLVFPRLFNGGKAELVLLDEEDLLNCGVEIIARPPGKNIGSIELMSGGEKALTAISLIMSIFLIKPSPFCVLDEVDAPLDEANVARFSQLIKEMSSLSQFIVITHNRKTMESADQLYGVTMEEAGQSKIVSVQVQQAFEALKSPKPAQGKAQLHFEDI